MTTGVSPAALPRSPPVAGALRWTAKKALRRGVAWWPRPAPRRPALRVLTYHRFARRPRDPFAVDPEAFARQVELIAASGRAIGLDALDRALAGQMRLRPDALLLTIDDGAESTLAVAAPILARHGVPAVAFVTASRLGRTEAGEPERFLGEDEVRRLPDHGIDVGSHGWTHASLGNADPAALARGFAASRHLLETVLDREVRAFAYPYGTARDHSAASRSNAQAAGYRLAFTSMHGAVDATADPLALPRIKIESGEGLAMFRRACDGGLDAWRAVDTWGTALQARR